MLSLGQAFTWLSRFIRKATLVLQLSEAEGQTLVLGLGLLQHHALSFP